MAFRQGDEAKALGWALAMMSAYERRLIETFGDPSHLVYSATHEQALRGACALAVFPEDAAEVYPLYRDPEAEGRFESFLATRTKESK